MLPQFRQNPAWSSSAAWMSSSVNISLRSVFAIEILLDDAGRLSHHGDVDAALRQLAQDAVGDVLGGVHTLADEDQPHLVAPDLDARLIADVWMRELPVRGHDEGFSCLPLLRYLWCASTTSLPKARIRSFMSLS